MKKLFLLLAMVGMMAVACTPGGGFDDGNTGNPNAPENPGDIPADKTQAIKFQDDNVKLICILHWDENGDGELSYEEAAAVTDLGLAFKDSAIIAFAELKYFTGLTNIADNAFNGCKNLVKITLPEQITSIGADAFYNCSHLTKITIPDGVTSIGKGAFNNCNGELIINSKTLVEKDYISKDHSSSNCPEYNGWLYGNRFTKLTIGDNITRIGDSVFEGCSSLTSVTIGNSVTSIGNLAFYSCSSLQAFYGKYASSDNRCLVVDGVLDTFAPSGLTSYTIPDCVTSIGKYAFSDCSSLTSVTIPDSVTSIGRSAFSDCSSLTSVTIGNSVTSIGNLAFYSCSSLTSVTIGNSVTSIGDWAFDGCRSLASVTIPDSVTSIGGWAFQNCRSLASVYCKPTTPPAVGGYMFDDNASGRKIYVPRNSVEAYKSARYWSDYASDIVGYDF